MAPGHTVPPPAWAAQPAECHPPAAAQVINAVPSVVRSSTLTSLHIVESE